MLLRQAIQQNDSYRHIPDTLTAVGEACADEHCHNENALRVHNAHVLPGPSGHRIQAQCVAFICRTICMFRCSLCRLRQAAQAHLALSDPMLTDHTEHA